jgi:hypothetical protein
MTRSLQLACGTLLALLMGALLTACGAAPPSAAATATAPATRTPSPTTTTAPESPDTTAFTVDPAVAALMRSQPPAEDEDFTPDSPALVGATGRPQLIEVFAYD